MRAVQISTRELMAAIIVSAIFVLFNLVHSVQGNASAETHLTPTIVSRGWPMSYQQETTGYDGELWELESLAIDPPQPRIDSFGALAVNTATLILILTGLHFCFRLKRDRKRLNTN